MYFQGTLQQRWGADDIFFSSFPLQASNFCAQGGNTSPGLCPGPANIQCCLFQDPSFPDEQSCALSNACGLAETSPGSCGCSPSCTIDNTCCQGMGGGGKSWQLIDERRVSLVSMLKNKHVCRATNRCLQCLQCLRRLYELYAFRQ